jgi:hypothetical protein
MVRINRKFEFIYRKGEIIIQTIYDDIESFSNGKAAVKIGKKRFYIDNSGNNI